MVHPVKTRPRGWLRLFRRFYTERGKGSVVCRSARLDIVPFNPFSLGARSVIEDFSTVNNAVGAVRIGDRSRIGLGNTIIGPVRIGDDVNLAQGITVSGLNHNFENICAPIAAQGVSTSEVVIADDVWIRSQRRDFGRSQYRFSQRRCSRRRCDEKRPGVLCGGRKSGADRKVLRPGGRFVEKN